MRRRVSALGLVQQAFDGEKLDFRIILVMLELRFVTACVHGFVAHRFGGLFQREENARPPRSDCSRRHITALHAAASDLHDDLAPLILGLLEIQQAVHAAVRALAVAFLERTRVNERERPMLELELVQFCQPLRNRARS